MQGTGEQGPGTGGKNEPRPPSLWQTIASVLAAFFGVQSSKTRERDFKHGKAVHFIVIGLLATAAFIFVVLLAVKFALKQAGL